MATQRRIYEVLNTAVSAKRNCMKIDRVNTEWENKWDDLIRHIEKNYLPSGSGFDAGTKVDEDACVNNRKIVLTFSYHHMDEHGYYDGWTEHKAVILPCFDGIEVHIKGALPRKYRHDKEYFGDTMHNALVATISSDEVERVLLKIEQHEEDKC